MRKIGNSKLRPLYLIKLQNGEFIKEIFVTEEEAKQYVRNNLTEDQCKIISFGELLMINRNTENETNRQTEKKAN